MVTIVNNNTSNSNNNKVRNKLAQIVINLSFIRKVTVSKPCRYIQYHD